AASHFPSVRLAGVGSRLGPIATAGGGWGGRWFYEVVVRTDGLMQVGWADREFGCDPVLGRGVGDHPHSWAYDGYRRKRWCVESAPYGGRWQAGDTVGVLLDADLLEMRFYLNGEDLGVAFVGFQADGIFPAASLNVGQSARFNFGQGPFAYPP
ncbi:concanavalin A-like lectin/glucanase domain-containing protein, partial [Tribonema minus]